MTTLGDYTPKQYRETLEASIEAMESSYGHLVDNEMHSAAWSVYRKAALFNDQDSYYMDRLYDRLVRIGTLRELVSRGMSLEPLYKEGIA